MMFSAVFNCKVVLFDLQKQFNNGNFSKELKITLILGNFSILARKHYFNAFKFQQIKANLLQVQITRMPL